MVFKKKCKVGNVGHVRYINGVISFQSVTLNVYCFEVDGILIDSGSQSLLKEFRPFFAQADIDKVVITHFHEDHTGGAAYLQDEHRLPIYMHEIMIKECLKKADYPLYRRVFWGSRSPFQAQQIGETFTSRNATWDVIHTPGHAKDHVAFLNRETRQLFSGDLYVQPKTKVILRDESIPTIIESIKKVLTYDFDELYCSHAGYIKDGRRALLNKLEYLQELEGKILLLQKQGYNEKEINHLIFKNKYPITLFSFGEWDSIHIIRSIIN